MARILILALCATGVLTAIVFAAPTLVVLGLFLGILPGLILGIVPTLFFYQCIFTAVWFALRRFHPAVGSVAGVVAAAAIGIQMPRLLNLKTETRLVEALERDVAPKDKIGGGESGLVEIVFPQDGYFSPRCDELCQMLLYNDGAQQVLIRPSKKFAPMSYRISTSDCKIDYKELKKLDESANHMWGDGAKHREVSKAVRMRIAGEECLVATPQPGGEAAMVIHWVDERVGERPRNFSLMPGEAWSRGVAVEVGGKVVARETVSVANLLGVPLSIEPYGGGIDFNGWRWSRKTTHVEDSKLDRIAMLKRMTSLDLDTPRGLDLSVIRKKLDGALNDPQGSGTAFALLKDYYEILRKDGFEVGDTDRVTRLLLDDRVTDFSFYSRYEDPKYAVPLRIRDAMLVRLGRLAKVKDRNAVSMLETIASKLPRATYAEAPGLDELLREPAERRLFPHLIPRLADRGPRAAVKFAEIIEDSWASADRAYDSKRDADAAMEGLCKLGGDARPVLPRMMALHQRYIKGSLTIGHKWRGMLVALGADPGEFDARGRKDQQSYRNELVKASQNCGGRH